MTAYVTKFSVRDRTRASLRLSVVNCRASRQFKRASQPSAPTVTFSASPTSIPNGQSSTLAWTSTNATACSGTGKGFSPSGASGSLAVSPGVTTTYGITCTGAGGSASQSVTVAVTAAPTLDGWHDSRGYGHDLLPPNSIAEYARDRRRGARQPGRGHRRSSEQPYTWWKVAFDDDLTGWTYQGGLAAASPNAPTLSFSASPAYIAPGASSTLSWSSTNATSCSGVGFSPSRASGSRLSLADCKHHVQHHLHRQRRIYDSNQRR